MKINDKRQSAQETRDETLNDINTICYDLSKNMALMINKNIANLDFFEFLKNNTQEINDEIDFINFHLSVLESVFIIGTVDIIENAEISNAKKLIDEILFRLKQKFNQLTFENQESQKNNASKLN